MSSLMIKGFRTVRDEQYSAEIENLFQKTEFESKQLLKSIENEKEQITAIKKQLEMRPRQIKEVEAETRRCEEEVKRLHRQFTYNVVMSESMKKQEIQLDEEIEKLRNKLEGLVKTTAERAVEYNEKLENYKTIWKSYKQKYTSSPKAQELQTLQQTIEKLASKKSELAQKRETLERKLNDLTTSNSENRLQKLRWTDWFVELASIKMEAMKLQNESGEIHQAKLKASEENRFLKQKLTSLKVKQLAKRSSLQADNVMYEAPQEQYEADIETGPGDTAEMIPEDTTLLVNPVPQDQLSIEHSSSESSQQLQQIQQFAFTDTDASNDAMTTTFGGTTGRSETMFSQSGFDSQGGFNFSGFGEDANIPQQGMPSGLQFSVSAESNPNPIFGQFSFTSPRVGGSGEEGTTGISCFGSPASVTSGGQENFFLFSGAQTPTTSSNVFNFF